MYNQPMIHRGLTSNKIFLTFKEVFQINGELQWKSERTILEVRIKFPRFYSLDYQEKSLG